MNVGRRSAPARLSHHPSHKPHWCPTVAPAKTSHLSFPNTRLARSVTTQLSDAPATPRIQIVQNPIRSIIGASSGNLVEWFDFYVYAFTSLYFSSAFFPGDNPTAQLMKSSGVYALGFFARPLGSWIFGRIADRAGRRHSMVIAVLLMSFGSLMVACLPTYANIGVAAPVLLTVARIIQTPALAFRAWAPVSSSARTSL